MILGGCNTGMISSNDFRTGTTIELDGQVWRVVEFLHVKPGKGSAFVRTKLKSVQSGNVVEKTFRAGESVQQAILEKSNLQHTYVESGDYVFMDMTSFEETRLTSEQIGKGSKYLKEGMEVNVIFHNGKILEVELPISITLKVTETDPGVCNTGMISSNDFRTGTTIELDGQVWRVVELSLIHI